MSASATSCVDHGAKYPYDAPDSWWITGADAPPPASDWAHAAARGVLSDLQDRRGIKHGFAEVDEDVRCELVATLAAIIRAAHQSHSAADERNAGDGRG